MDPAKNEFLAVVDRLKTMNADPDAMADYEAGEEQRRAATITEVLRQDGVPRRLRGSVGSGATTQATAAVDGWAASGGWCLCMSGPAGVGKSFAAGYWLWRRIVDDRRNTDPNNKKRWFPAMRLAAVSSYGQELEDLCGVAALVIDDLGVEYTDERGAFLSKLDYLLDSRYSEERPTIITTNLDLASFSRRYTERVVDRIREGGSFRRIEGKSQRGGS